ncbi:MAG TPA: glycoside hydrolase family 2 TIM barrel-domain containing protein [Pyrinomonadaceae bacterium]|nr:glycoside hydrolase family 2 TIM barrel-domain containing protein [Pyrinomonadaceae bacterium]
MKRITRRSFLKSTSIALAGGTLLGKPVSHLAYETSANYIHSERITKWEYRRGNLGGPWEAWRKANDDANVWTKVEVPHCFNASDSVDPDVPYYQGPGWYRTRVEVKNPYPMGRTLLHFEGTGQKSEVFIHTDKVGSHVGGYDEFTIDITDQVNQRPKIMGEIAPLPVAVMCDNSRDLEMIPSNLSDFNLYGGLYRYVNLVYLPVISIERLHVVAELLPNGKAKVIVRARLYNPSEIKETLELSLKVRDPNNQLVHSGSTTLKPWTGTVDLFTFTIESPARWSPKRPSLYFCVAEINSEHGASRIGQTFGVRSFEFIKNGPFKLNGERLLIRGTQRHEDHAGVAAAMTEELMRKEMRLIKDLGANFVRLGHFQQSRTILDLCDELGLLVWEEIPWCRGGLGGEQYKEQARRMLRNMIDQHRNHPSVIIWGLGNENDWPGDFEYFDKDRIRAFMIELNTLAHTLDPTRKTAIRRCDFCKDVVDVYSPSIWSGWYQGRYTEYKSRTLAEIKKVNHFLHMEWGGDSHARRHSEAMDQVFARAPQEGDWSETYICNVFDWHLKEQETMPELTGSAQWIFKDFATTLRPGNPVPRVNQKGLVERDFTLKEGYFVFQSYWAEQPMVHIYGHTWPVRWGEPDESKLVKVYSNCPTVELFVNGVSSGMKKRNSQDFPAAGLRWLVKFRKGENVIRAVGNGGITDEIKFVYQTEKWDQPAKLLLAEIRDGVEVKLVDAKGVQCLDARNFVRFALAGDGELIDNLGTSTTARKVQLYNGRAQISVQRKGKSVVSVSCEGLPTAFLTI